MSFRNSLSKINWRLILVHLIACWLFIYAFKVFISMHDRDFLLGIMNPKVGENIDTGRLNNDLKLLNLGGPAGLLIACLISVFICLKRGWFWANTLIVFLIALLLDHFDLFGWDFLQTVFLAPGDLLKLQIPWYFLINGGIMLAIGLLLFFLPALKRFIAPTPEISK